MTGRRSAARRLFRWVVRLLPFDFRRDYGRDLESTFADEIADEAATGGSLAAARCWLRSIGGILRVAPREHADAARQDVGYAARAMRRHPAFTAAALLSLGLGIGANTAIFSLVNAIFLHPLAVDRPERLVALYTIDDLNPGYNATAFANYRDYRDADIFDGLAAYTWAPMNLASGGEPSQVFGQLVTGNYFAVVGVQPMLGRAFEPDEDRTDGTHPVVVLSYALWERRFGRDPAIVGRSIRLNGQPFTVVGVAPRSFVGVDVGLAPELWVPTMMHRRIEPTQPGLLEERRALEFSVVGRLRADAPLGRAQEAVNRVSDHLAAAFPRENNRRRALLLPLATAAVNPNARDLVALAGVVLMIIVGIVLLVACANVANLLLGRTAARRREIAVRIALGAGRGRIARQLLTEQLLLSSAAAVLGLVLGLWTRDLLWALKPAIPVPIDLDRSLDVRILAFTALLSVVTALAFGAAPMLQVLTSDVVGNLKGRGEPWAGRRRRIGLRDAIVIAEVAFSLLAVVMAGLFVRSLGNARRIAPGFDADHLSVVMVNLGGQGYTEPQVVAFERRALERIGALPDVRSAAFSTLLPLFGGGYGRTVFLDGDAPPGQANGQFVMTNAVSLHYFDTLGIQVLRGRDFSADDRPGSTPVVLVNATMAERFWPGKDPVGRRFHFFDEAPVQVIGVVANSKLNSLGESPEPCAYLALAQRSESFVTLQVRTTGDPRRIVGDLDRTFRSLDPTLPLLNLRAMPDLLAQSLWTARAGAALLAVFALLASCLAVIGLYSVLAYTVTLRTRELGLRLALGATPRQAIGLVLRRGITMTAIGVVAGAGLAILLARAATGLLYGVDALDRPTFALVPALFLAVASAACYFPARRAAGVDPLVALGSD